MARSNGFEFDKKSFRELDKNLRNLEKLSTQKAVLRKSLKDAAQPIAEHAASIAPYDEGNLSNSVTVSNKLNKYQARLQKKAGGKFAVQMYIGPTSPKGGLVEFGTVEHAPQPFLRPAWESGKEQLLEDLKNDLAIKIDKAVKRQAKRNAKKGMQ